MARIIRKGIDLSQGHCYSPRVCLTGSDNVFVEGLSVVRALLDDYGQTHSCGHSHHSMGPGVQGSPNVFVNGMPIHRNGDLIQCGDRGGNGSTTVFCN